MGFAGWRRSCPDLGTMPTPSFTWCHLMSLDAVLAILCLQVPCTILMNTELSAFQGFGGFDAWGHTYSCRAGQGLKARFCCYSKVSVSCWWDKLENNQFYVWTFSESMAMCITHHRCTATPCPATRLVHRPLLFAGMRPVHLLWGSKNGCLVVSV